MITALLLMACSDTPADSLLRNPDDPFPEGYTLGDLWGGALDGGDGVQPALQAQRQAVAARGQSRRIHDPAVGERMAASGQVSRDRLSPFAERIGKQQAALKLPAYPTTTIGSFPQTKEIRAARRDWKAGKLDDSGYTELMKQEITRAVRYQEQVDLDVLVHGEAERNDMVEYFGELLDGFAFTRFGWVQSYGSRCVKPPIIFGDVQRPEAMTVAWAQYAQSLTDKPVKGMLTGPVTILQWSFVRDDQRAPIIRLIIGVIKVDLHIGDLF